MFASSSKDIDAKVVDGAMVVAFNAGDTPRVWRADIGHMKTATLEVRGAKGKHQLVLKSGETDDVVGDFTDKEQAAAALRLLTDALMKGEGASAAAAPAAKSGVFGTLFKVIGVLAVLYVVGLFGLRMLVMSSLSHRAGMGGPPGMHAPQSPVQQGTPVAPDDLLGGGQ